LGFRYMFCLEVGTVLVCPGFFFIAPFFLSLDPASEYPPPNFFFCPFGLREFFQVSFSFPFFFRLLSRSAPPPAFHRVLSLPLPSPVGSPRFPYDLFRQLDPIFLLILPPLTPLPFFFYVAVPNTVPPTFCLPGWCFPQFFLPLSCAVSFPPSTVSLGCPVSAPVGVP